MTEEYKQRLKMLARQLVDIYSQVRALHTEIELGEISVTPVELQTALTNAKAIIDYVGETNNAGSFLKSFIAARDVV